ncbi:50S ribosomal protein L17 [uncultured Sunxiuqinia sp.]|uniref:50S ribosomal protein L17 n=1 Tax=uncultured Sunxiuqinia sp. TaxID=1573825 RepID=UPI00374791DD
MRHNKKFNHLGRKTAHRKAMLSNMANSLIFSKRITTTVAKAKALKMYVEPLITKAKNDTTHSRRIVFSVLKSKTAVAELFRDVADKVGERPGGYTRILKTGNRLGDNAEMCIIELVDYNENLLSAKEDKPKKRRSRRGGAKKSSEDTAATQPKKKEVAEPKAEAVVKEPKVEEVKEEGAAAEEVKAEEPAKEELKADDEEKKTE